MADALLNMLLRGCDDVENLTMRYIREGIDNEWELLGVKLQLTVSNSFRIAVYWDGGNQFYQEFDILYLTLIFRRFRKEVTKNYYDDKTDH